MYKHLGAFESTQIFGTGQDIFGTTHHLDLWREDLTRLRNAGISELRYSIPWHRIERTPGVYDWKWMDQPLQFMEEAGMQPIADPLHHTSFPEWLTEGFLNAEFPVRYELFLSRICERYPFIKSYTVFNEPLPTTLFCSYTGMWYPHRASDSDFVAMLLQVGRAICRGCEALKKQDSEIQFVHVETAEHHAPLDKACSQWTEFVNRRRFLITDLILGRVQKDHPLYSYLTNNGASDSDLGWFEEHSAIISVLGLTYYIHSEMSWFWSRDKKRPDIAPIHPRPRGFASLAEDYIKRYRLPIMLSETNIRGSISERVSWLKFMESECEELSLAGHNFTAFCWYPSIDTTDWSNACTQHTGILDPQGVWSLQPKSLRRVDTEMSQLYSSLARGGICSAQMPPFRFGPELRKRLQGYSGITSAATMPLARPA